MTARRARPPAKRQATPHRAPPRRAPPRDEVPSPAAPFARRDITYGALIGLGAFVLYLFTVCPTIYVEDSAELSTAAAVFGVPHPPGYPLYTLLAGLFVRVFPLGDVGYRSNLFSAACGAGAVAMLWVVVRRIGVGRIGALAAAVSFAVGATFWSECLAAEVHAFNALLIALALLCSFEALRAPSTRRYAWAGLTIGLAIGHRNINGLFLAPLLVLLELERRKRGQGWRTIGAAGGALLASAAVYLYLPIAASRDPAINMGAPSSFARFWAVVTAQAYVRHLASASLATDLGRVSQFVRGLPGNLGLGIFAAPVGLVLLRRRQQRAALVALGWLAAASFGFGVIYNVPDVASYWIPAYLALAIAAGVGFDAWRGRSAIVLPVIAAAAIPLVGPSVTLRWTPIAGVYGQELLDGAPPRALIVSLADTETHVMAYTQAVARLRKDVVLASASELDGWYVDQLSRRHPDVNWPAPSATMDWLTELYARNHEDRPICATQPLHFGPPGSQLLPSGLLYCVTPRIEAADLQRTVAFWNSAARPSPAEVHHPDAHVRMLDFSFALSRFMLAAALAETGAFAEARAQLTAVLALDPDGAEHAIVRYVAAIGREGHRDLGIGLRAQQALQLPPNDPKLVDLLRL
jgi:hypothetical protein